MPSPRGTDPYADTELCGWERAARNRLAQARARHARRRALVWWCVILGSFASYIVLLRACWGPA